MAELATPAMAPGFATAASVSVIDTAPGAAAAEPSARVMIVDDSAFIRGAIARLLSSDPAIRVVARAADGATAIAAVSDQSVDVIVLDIEMPGMDGLEALPLLLRARPGVRIIMASTLTTRGAAVTLRALRLGASDFIAKPAAGDLAQTTFRDELIAKIKGLTRGTLRRELPATRSPLTLTGRPAQPPLLLAIGSSTGGPQALFALYQALGGGLPVPIVVTQHMPASFVPTFAEQLHRQGGPPCEVAQEGMVLLPGHSYLAPGDRHLLVNRMGDRLVAAVVDDPPENHCRPAVDPMLRSAAVASRGRTLVIMLTGMGQDGLAGTRAVIEAGGTALAQDEASSVVWGMPGAIAQAGLCHEVAPIPAIARTARSLLAGRGWSGSKLATGASAQSSAAAIASPKAI